MDTNLTPGRLRFSHFKYHMTLEWERIFQPWRPVCVYGGGLTSVHPLRAFGVFSYLSDTQLSRQRDGQHQTAELVLFCHHRLGDLWTQQNPTFISRGNMWWCSTRRVQTFTAWVGSQSSCRTPKHTTHTRSSSSFCFSADVSSDVLPLLLGSSFALLLGGGSCASEPAASWDLLFSSLHSAAESWDVELVVMKVWSSLSISCVKQ